MSFNFTYPHIKQEEEETPNLGMCFDWRVKSEEFDADTDVKEDDEEDKLSYELLKVIMKNDGEHATPVDEFDVGRRDDGDETSEHRENRATPTQVFTEMEVWEADSVFDDELGPGQLCEECRNDFDRLSIVKFPLLENTDFERPRQSCRQCGRSLSGDDSRRERRFAPGHVSPGIDASPDGSSRPGGSDWTAATSPAHADEQPYVCHECGKGFAYPCSLKEHYRTHTGEWPHVCGECGKGFSYPSALKLHSRSHNGERPHVCAECGRAFTRPFSLREHIKTHAAGVAGGGGRPQVRRDCGKPFPARAVPGARPGAHGKEHPDAPEERGPGERPVTRGETPAAAPEADASRNGPAAPRGGPHACGECGRAFSRASGLREHAKGHAADKPHACAECGKRFARASGLKEHAKGHAAVKPHACGECGKRFLYRSILKAHSRTHSAERPHVCAECGKGFADVYGLRTHTKTHTGERPHVCPECGKGFLFRSALMAHARTHR